MTSIPKARHVPTLKATGTDGLDDLEATDIPSGTFPYFLKSLQDTGPKLAPYVAVHRAASFSGNAGILMGTNERPFDFDAPPPPSRTSSEYSQQQQPQPQPPTSFQTGSPRGPFFSKGPSSPASCRRSTFCGSSGPPPAGLSLIEPKPSPLQGDWSQSPLGAREEEVDSALGFQGSLMKLQPNLRRWKERFFVQNHNMLHYFAHRDSLKPSGSLDLGAVTSISPTKVVGSRALGAQYADRTFAIFTPDKIWYLMARSRFEMEYWCEGLVGYLRLSSRLLSRDSTLCLASPPPFPAPEPPALREHITTLDGKTRYRPTVKSTVSRRTIFFGLHHTPKQFPRIPFNHPSDDWTSVPFSSSSSTSAAASNFLSFPTTLPADSFAVSLPTSGHPSLDMQLSNSPPSHNPSLSMTIPELSPSSLSSLSPSSPDAQSLTPMVPSPSPPLNNSLKSTPGSLQPLTKPSSPSSLPLSSSTLPSSASPSIPLALSSLPPPSPPASPPASPSPSISASLAHSPTPSPSLSSSSSSFSPSRAGEPHPVVAQPRSPRSVLPSAKAQSQSKIPPTPPRRTNKRLSYGVQMNISASNSAEEMLTASQRRKVMASRDDFELELSELSAMKRSATAMPRSPRAAMMMSLGGTFDLFPETSEPKISVQAELLRGSSWHEVSLLPGETIVWRCSYVCLLYQDEVKKVFRSKKNKRQMFSTSRASNNDASELQIRSSDPTAQGECSYAELLASKSPVFIEKKGEQRYTASIDGRLLLSDHKVIFTPKLDSPLGCIEVPLMYIKKVKKAVLPCTLVLFLHDGRVIVLSFAAHPPETTKIFLARLRSVIPAKFSSETIFAFKYHRDLCQLREHSTRLSSIDAKHYYHQAWKFDIILDYARLGLPNRKWHVVNNRDFAICATYPTYLCVPSSIDVATIMKAAQFRTKSRIPVLTWKHPTSDATLCRSSQPNVGLLGSGDRSDEMLMEAIKASNPNSATLHLCDARPKVNAEANKLLGAGYESTSAYKGMKIKFFSIDNIHVMRDSWQKLQTLCQPQNEGNDRWLSDLEATGWFQHLKKIMAGVLHIVHLIEDEGASVVIHCSDGWDRTAQLCSLAQMLLDPFYRTVHGFAVLIEKDWLAFGHKFQERTGHLYRQHPSERSPVFLQFLDCCYQLIQQFPFSFEFNTALLRFIGEAAADQIFGTFLCNSAKERGLHGIYQETESAWSYVFSNIESFTSSLYAPSVTRDVLYPSIAIQSFKLWETYHFRWSHTTKVKRTATAVDELASENSKLLAILREKEKELEQLIRNESGQKK